VLYSLADPETLQAGADSAEKVRSGLRELRSYVVSDVRDAGDDGIREPPTEYLKRAIACFRSARRSDPSYIDAYVYEGVASDLLEDHQGAIERFEYARKLIVERPKGRAEDDKERQEWERQLKIVKYNEAVAHLRDLYSVEGIRKSIAVLDDLLGSAPDAKSDPIIALALAAKADAIACWTLHPEEFFKSEIFPALFDEFSDGLEVSFGIEGAGAHEGGVVGSIQYKIVVDETVRRVTEITDQLFQVLRELKVSRSAEWDARAILQFEWSITNALGDLYLYAYETWVRRGRLPKVPPVDNYLNLAIDYLNQCAFLFPPGVEILSNLGTLYLFKQEKGDLDKARTSLEEVIKLNQNYEYAYYRYAETYSVEGRYEEANGIVQRYKSTGRAVEIPSFGDLIAKVCVELARSPEKRV
jgi:tetratricopeptide (TPR) repeat protein